ncbi:lipase 1-like isoform X1 [Coccinella septempunctata]|uniref:lipase 1-like isoform X1 n=1 Tax=Coccinella septempunctata TaxID=41139 RepID=UPI001D08BC8B|nr:lipase 1-like isoform X1 [Coccinella septempunctata]
MFSRYFFLGTLFLVLVFSTTESYYIHPDTGLNITQLLSKYGYPFENHIVQTKDGYLLTLHRMPHGRQNISYSGRPAVLLVHGLLSQSTDFVNGGPEKSISYLLADRGYDVWLLNCRGNTHSRRHISLDPDVDKEKFWDFSWHEMGIYDLPNTIDYILNITNQDALFYIGHSQGTTTFFVMASLLPKYNGKIRHMSALAPTALFSNNMDIKYRTLVNYRNELQLAFLFFNIHEFLGHMDLYLNLVKKFCLKGMVTSCLCEALYVLGVGYSPTEFNMTLLPVMVSNSPSGFSVKQVFHYLQLFSNGGLLRPYDHGFLFNWIKYWAPTPPNYNLSNIVAPVTLHYAMKDQLVDRKDAEILAILLPNASKRMVPVENFTHLDFLWGNHVKPLIYDYILNEMEKY